MHQIGVVGLSYRHAGVEDVSRFALPRAQMPGRLPALRTLLKAAEILYVGTCNRVEVVYATDDGSAAGDCRSEVFRILTGREPQPGEAARILRAWTGEAAVEHLFLLACGLDSAQTGGHEIAAQARRCGGGFARRRDLRAGSGSSGGRGARDGAPRAPADRGRPLPVSRRPGGRSGAAAPRRQARPGCPPRGLADDAP